MTMKKNIHLSPVDGLVKPCTDNSGLQHIIMSLFVKPHRTNEARVISFDFILSSAHLHSLSK
jgi:hypothetical protein